MSPIHWVASNGPMPERLPPESGDEASEAPVTAPVGADGPPPPSGGDTRELGMVEDGLVQPGLHTTAEVHFAGGLTNAGPTNAGPTNAGPTNAVAVGIDSVDVPRLTTVLQRTPAMRERCFTTTELVDAATGGDEIGHLGTCFAAKEAVAKALGCGIGPVGFHDIELVRSDSGAPGLVLGGNAASLAEQAGIGGWLVSATHTDTVAQTVVIALKADA